MQLYKIVDEILLRVSDIPEEPSEAQEEASQEEKMLKDLEQWQTTLKSKLEACAAVVKNLQAEENMLRDEAARLLKRANHTRNRCNWLKEYIKSQLLRLNKKSFNAGIFKLRIQSSPLKVEISDVSSIPDEFKELVSEWKVDKSKIAQIVRNTGELVEGVKIHRSEHLRIY